MAVPEWADHSITANSVPVAHRNSSRSPSTRPIFILIDNFSATSSIPPRLQHPPSLIAIDCFHVNDHLLFSSFLFIFFLLNFPFLFVPCNSRPDGPFFRYPRLASHFYEKIKLQISKDTEACFEYTSRSGCYRYTAFDTTSPSTGSLTQLPPGSTRRIRRRPAFSSALVRCAVGPSWISPI